MRSPCCCCLLRPPDKDLYTPYIFLGVTETFSDLLEECFQIFGFDHEYGICDVCVGRLRDARDFKLQVQRSQAELRARLESARSVKEEDDLVKSETSQHNYNAIEENTMSEEVNLVKSESTHEVDNDLMAEQMVSEEATLVKHEVDVKEELCAAQAALYAGHEVTRELVLGPEGPQPRDVAFTLYEPAAKWEWEMSDDAVSERGSSPSPAEPCAVAAPSSPGLVSSRAREQLAMACSVRLERLQHDKMSPRTSPHQSSLTTHMRVRAEQLTESTEPRDLTPAAAGAETYTCDTCGEQFSRKSSIITHLKKHIANKSPITTLDRVSLNSVNKSHSITDSQVTPDSREDELQCEIKLHIQSEDKSNHRDVCSKQFKENHELLNHTFANTEQKPFLCEICNKQFKRKKYLTEHLRVHTGKKPYCCSMCDKRYALKFSLKEHTKIHTGEKPYECKVCFKKFSQKRPCLIHILRHTGQKHYACDACPKQYYTRSQLRTHQRLHTGENPVTLFTCDVCLKQFKQKARLIRHMISHPTMQRPSYACEVCHKKFERASYLRNHNRVHTGEKPYTCDTCAKQLAHKQDLIVHIRIHTGQKPYACEVCCKKFKSRSNLASHKRSHTGEKPKSSKSVCEVCLKEFGTKERLRIHVQCVHEKLKPYACEICGKSFGRRGHRKRHQISLHADTKREHD